MYHECIFFSIFTLKKFCKISKIDITIPFNLIIWKICFKTHQMQRLRDTERFETLSTWRSCRMSQLTEWFDMFTCSLYQLLSESYRPDKGNSSWAHIQRHP